MRPYSLASSRLPWRGHRRVTLGTAVVVIIGLGLSSCGAPSPPVARSAASSAPSYPSATSAKVDAAITKLMKDNDIPGAIVGVWTPAGQYVKGLGVADKVTKAPMTTDLYMRIASETKTFTLTAILQLVDQHRVRLEDPISMYVPGVPNGDKITIRDLGRMQSGIADYGANADFQKALGEDPSRSFTPAQLMAYSFALPPTATPGTKFEYANINTVLLGLVVEKLSGLKLGDYFAKNIYPQAGLTHTSYPVDASFPGPHARGYTTQTLSGKEEDSTEWNPSWGGAAGILISTLEDMHKWSAVVATGQLLSPEAQKQRMQLVDAGSPTAGDGYGLGIFVLGGWVGHNGSIPGYKTLVAYQPEEKATIVVLINRSDNGQLNPAHEIGAAATRILTPQHSFPGVDDVDSGH